MNGGYYVYEIADDIMVLGLNGMYPFYENFSDKEVSDQMIEWVSQVLEDNPDKYFLTSTHVYFGNNFYTDLEVLWDLEYTNKLLQALLPH